MWAGRGNARGCQCHPHTSAHIRGEQRWNADARGSGGWARIGGMVIRGYSRHPRISGVVIWGTRMDADRRYGDPQVSAPSAHIRGGHLGNADGRRFGGCTRIGGMVIREYPHHPRISVLIIGRTRMHAVRADRRGSVVSTHDPSMTELIVRVTVGCLYSGEGILERVACTAFYPI